MAMVNVVSIAAYSGGPDDWLGPKVGDRLALFCIYQMT